MIYDITVKDNKGKDVKLEKYKGKVLLIVNTATKCGFTPQYQGLEDLYEEYKEQGFEILDFPCNQFGHQAPEDDEGIDNFCSLNFGTSFDRFQKIDVNGENESPLYTFLKKEEGGILSDKIKWNFTKFLVDRNGNVVDRFSPNTKPEKLKKDIESLL
ncbi:glutathione peroxidase [Anaerococcus sp. AGMB00486]|uniref:Glutathione peroxidase n=2 Tax=Anaerococcus TaxID=165779 RepID=A0ABX2NAA0_9FIRM|nr:MULTISPECIES: glutathione peroxidase [Anaerococcus]MDY3006714.1 glutathione peroxidase [Anaerococcus porci]MSS77720.1 glutathione peroxidase [Anaerococcus porci]NVF11575.1 glutathione peroxidase [Anaerococcus faecalis]